MGSVDYPQGDGLPDCPLCFGRGVVELPLDEWHPLAVGPQTRICRCVYVRDVLANMERGWKGLARSKPTPSPLKGKEQENLWVTATDKTLRRHLRYVVARMEPRWYFAVVSDADLMDSWLHNVPTEDLLDADVGRSRGGPRPTDKYTALVDLVEPPDLLILRVGVKAARNKAMPEVLLEVLQHRGYQSKPTWLVDFPNCRLVSGHIAWDQRVGELLSDWDRVELSEDLAGSLPSLETLVRETTHEARAPGKKETRSVLGATLKRSKEGQDDKYRSKKKGGTL